MTQLENPVAIERRSTQNRRQNQIPFYKVGLSRGERCSYRRADDCRRVTVLDQYQSSLLIFTLIVLSLSLVDAVLTLTLLEQGAVELNPVMQFYITLGHGTFVITKYGLTALPLIIMVVAHPIISRRYRIGSFIFLFFGLAFGSVVLWEIYLLGNIS